MIKRSFDLFFAFIVLIIMSPLLLIIAIIIKSEDRGSVFYRSQRTGRHNRPFILYKFRTMVVGAEKMGGSSTALCDPRLTKFGRYLRKYKLDELAQLLNILKGEMSFVGPRPQVEKYTRLYNDEEKIVLTLKPGLTDYASIRFINLDQILGNDRVDEKYQNEIEPEKNKLRIKYAQHHPFWIDCLILVKTISGLLKIR